MEAYTLLLAAPVLVGGSLGVRLERRRVFAWGVERMNAKIRDAQLQKIPYMLVVGRREEETQGVSVRLRTNENRGMMDLPAFVDHLRSVVDAKDGL